MEKWFVINKGADFEKLGKEFGITEGASSLQALEAQVR